MSRGIVAENSSVWRLRRQRRDDLADVADEAHVEHAVGLVEHEHLDAATAATWPCSHEIEQAARRRDQHVDAARERLDLRLLADAAEDDRVRDSGRWRP